MPSPVNGGSHGAADGYESPGRLMGLDRAGGVEGLVDLGGLAVPLAADGLAEAEPLGALGAGCCRVGRGPEAAAVGWWPRTAGAVAGLNVATESIAPATRQTARMLASSGMMDPCPATGDTSRRSLLRRRLARCSR